MLNPTIEHGRTRRFVSPEHAGVEARTREDQENRLVGSMPESPQRLLPRTGRQLIVDQHGLPRDTQ